jgi:hypothetical protein
MEILVSYELTTSANAIKAENNADIDKMRDEFCLVVALHALYYPDEERKGSKNKESRPILV